ncbi:hypothetical protein OBV_32750 [Oscillibacter valericigenes Sjm18-20]|nr:hypothetical protein OBV_32750 [Oscillibacter valericigenes Sjm18-20]
MKEFLTAALPWVVIGVCVALLAVNRKKQKANKENRRAKDDKSDENHMTDGMCAGAAFGSSGIVDLATSISLSIYQGEDYRTIMQKGTDSGDWKPIDWIPSSAH